MGGGVLLLPNSTHTEEGDLVAARPEKEKVIVHWILLLWLLERHILSLHLHWKRKISDIAHTTKKPFTPSSESNLKSCHILHVSVSLRNAHFFFQVPFHAILIFCHHWTNFVRWPSPIKPSGREWLLALSLYRGIIEALARWRDAFQVPGLMALLLRGYNFQSKSSFMPCDSAS